MVTHTTTGRFRCSDPNQSNIPKPDDVEWIEWTTCGACKGSGLKDAVADIDDDVLCAKCMGNGRHPTMKGK